MQHKTCDRCLKEIKRGKDEEYKLEHLFSGNEDTANKYWDLCGNCVKQLKHFMDGRNLV